MDLYWWSSKAPASILLLTCYCCGRYLEESALITNRADVDSFLERIHESDILQWVITQRRNSDWVYVLVTNVTFFVNRILQHPIGCVDAEYSDEDVHDITGVTLDDLYRVETKFKMKV